ncbi:MAG: homoserine dehydrogenase [Oscillospiraceae bacterium]|nr:homoserine dehydrogenase [Oscillospiraceae bacterium]
MNIALLGFGTVGSHFYELASKQDDIRVSTVLSRRARPELKCAVTSDFDEIVRDESIGVVVEVIGGVEPAYSYVCAAMRAGKHVVTANKQLMCEHYDELLALARKSGVSLRCTAAAGGGIPWLSSLERVSRFDTICSVEGILNGTTNYILSAMTENGADYAAALREAQSLGYAEADPTADVEGLDARRKLVLSANLAFGVSVKENDIPCVGISHIKAADVAKAKELGYTFKLIVHAERSGDSVSAFVCPTLFPVTAPEAHTGGAGNIATLRAEHIGPQSYAGAGAGGFPTASSVLTDCYEVLRGCGSYYTDKAEPCKIGNSAARFRWLLRSGGDYSFETCAAAEAFRRYYALLESDPDALIARVAE